MYLRLLLFFLFYLGSFFSGVFVVAQGVRRLLSSSGLLHRIQGKKNLKTLKKHEEETCRLCLESVDPRVDLYDKRIGWYHSRCHDYLFEPKS